MRSVHYYIQSLFDLEDVIQTINGIIGEKTPLFESNNIKKECSISSMPLKDQMSGMIIKVNMPDNILSKDNIDKKAKVNKTTNLDSTKSNKATTNLPVVVKKTKKD